MQQLPGWLYGAKTVFGRSIATMRYNVHRRDVPDRGDFPKVHHQIQRRLRPIEERWLFRVVLDTQNTWCLFFCHTESYSTLEATTSPTLLRTTTAGRASYVVSRRISKRESNTTTLYCEATKRTLTKNKTCCIRTDLRGIWQSLKRVERRTAREERSIPLHDNPS